MKFSICIPNFNYAHFIGKTIDSVLAQDHHDLEVLVADNQSTDDSVAVVQAFGDERVSVWRNNCNVGFARNLDQVGRRAGGDYMVMLSSDDLVRPGALATYARILRHLGDDASRTVLTSRMDVIDADDIVTGTIGPDPEVWSTVDLSPDLEAIAGAPVYCADASTVLSRSMFRMRNPASFAATCYPRALYEALEGYGGARLINPDKWFNWRLLGEATRICFVDAPLFAYRWHAQNQTAQQAVTGALKYLVDEYAMTLEVDSALLAKAGVTRAQIEDAFVEYDVARHGLATLARGDRARAKRILAFGKATYPWKVWRNPGAWALRALGAFGIIGATLASMLYHWRRPAVLDARSSRKSK